MIQRSGPVVVRFCLALVLAIALVVIGVVISLDYWFLASNGGARVSLMPGGGLMSVLIGSSILTLLFGRTNVAVVLACLTSLVALCLASLALMPAGEIARLYYISVPLAVVVMLVEFTLLSAIYHSKGGLVGYITGPVVVAAGTLSLFSFWFPQLQFFSLGSIPESIIVVSPLAILTGLVLPFVHTIVSRGTPNYSLRLVLVGVSGIVLTTMTWHAMRVYNSSSLQDRAEVMADQLQASTKAAFNDDRALIRRLAKRQEPITDLSMGSGWFKDVQSYLNDFPKIQLVGILEPFHKPFVVHSRSSQHEEWLDRFLRNAENSSWLDHVAESGLPHLSPPQSDSEGRMLALLASPIAGATGPPWNAFAVVDLEKAYRSLIQHYDGALSLRVYYDGHFILKLSSGSSGAAQVPLAVRDIGILHDSQWQIEVYSAESALPGDVLYLPPLVLFTGLILSFLTVLCHLLWRESERRAASLRILNTTINEHLSREQSLRHSNERIMKFSRDMLCSINAKGLFTFVNPASEAILGYRPEQLIGKPYNTLIPPSERDATAEEMRVLMSGEKPVRYGFKNHQRHLDGHLVVISWTADWSEEDETLFCVGRDMTDTLMAEVLMREREQFFSLSPDMFCIVDLNSHFFELNKAFVDTLGYEREELLGVSYMQLIHEDDREKVVEAVKSLISGEPIKDLQIRVRNKNNAEHWLELSAALSSDDLIYVAARDTTDLRHTQEKLRESETLLRIAEKAARIGGWVVDIATGESRWSPVMFDIFEVPFGSAPLFDQALEFYTPESRRIIANALSTCSLKGVPFDDELQIRTQRGHLRWVRVIGQAIKDEDDRIIQVQGGLQDITASHQALEQIRRFAEHQARIFESITDAFFTLDRDWRFTYVNKRSEELLKKNRHELEGQSLWHMFPAVLNSEFERQYRHAMKTGDSVSFEAYYAPLDNWLEVSAYPSDEGLAVYYRSINERKEAQERLEQAMAELERSNRDLQDFAFVASHDLQEPLRKIQAFSDRLLTRSSHFDEQEQDYLQRMQSAARRMQALVQDLLTYSRVTTKARPMTSCDTDQVLADVLQDMETDILQERALVDAGPLPPILGDATQIRQVLQNLLSNAIKFHKPDQSPEVAIYAEAVGEEGWTLVVSDKGVGFDIRYSEKLFHPFQRLHSQSFSGTGIGLAIVKKILIRHGATVQVESEIERGTTFRIHFPTDRRTKESRND